MCSTECLIIPGDFETSVMLLTTLHIIPKMMQRSGDSPGQWKGHPHGLWIDKFGDMYVAEVGTQKAIQKFIRI